MESNGIFSSVMHNLFDKRVWISIIVAGVTVIIWIIFSFRKIKAKVLPSKNEGTKPPKFRKRDKVLFYGRKMLRKVRTFTKNTVGTYSGLSRDRMKKRQLILRLTKRLLQRKRESQPQLRVKEPSQSLLELDLSEQNDGDHRLPPEVVYMLRSVRVFGHFHKPMFLELCKHVETKSVFAGSYLFKIGDPDDSIFVVENGKINVCITESDGVENVVKEVQTGDSIHSLLSIVDILTGHPSPYKTVSAKAVQDSVVLRLPVQAFQSVFERYPESMVRVVQIIMVRLQRVTFLALHNYLGLSSELMNPQTCADLKSLSVQGPPSDSSHKYLKGQNTFQSFSRDNTSEDKNLKAKDSSFSEETVKLNTRSVSVTEDGEFQAGLSDFESACIRARIKSREFQSFVSCGEAPNRLNSEVMSPSGQTGYKRSDSEPANIAYGVVVNDQHQLELAAEHLSMLFKLKDSSLLKGKLFLRYYKVGTVLQKQGDQDANLIFVVSGTLNILQQVVGHETKETILFCAYPGDIVGSLAVLTGEPSFFSIRVKTDSRVAQISKTDFYMIMREQPSVVLNVAHTILKPLSSFVRQIDFALDWMMIEAGRALFRQDDHSDSIYIVLTGRLRSIITTAYGKKELVGEYGRGDLVGIVEVLTQSERATTVMAVRDTELACLPAGLLNNIKRKYPQIVTRLIHLLGERILYSLQSRDTVNLTDQFNLDSRPIVANLSTVAVLPISSDVPLTNFTLELQHALNGIGPTSRLTSEILKTRLGAAALESVNKFRLFSWLGQHEDMHRMVLYQCDYTMTRWTANCVRQADCILIVGIKESGPAVGEIETKLENMAVRAQKELILLYQADAETPRGTVEWLNARDWCTSHHHIRCSKRVFSRKSKSKTMEVYEKLFQTAPDRQSDFSRLARFLTGTSIGLVLGGGGARGIAHVGMIRAMTEAGIPIDMVGGTSIGSFMGALWSEERNVTRFVQRAREWSIEMTSLWKKIWDLTYPVTSMFTGGSFNKGIENVFKDRQIEDLWIPYFCVTTDITASLKRIHKSGSLWRYVRASMSLSGYLPPLCDPLDGHLLLDGGYVNNLPADAIRAMGAQTVFAIDVGSRSQDDKNLTNYGDQLSGWWLLWKRWIPWTKPVMVPDMTEIQSRLAYVSCVRELEIVKNSDYCEYIRPPIDRYKTLQFGSFDEISEVGYNHGKTLFSGWLKGGLLKELYVEKTRKRPSGKKSFSAQSLPVMTTFTDLAEMVSKIDEPQSRCSSESEDMTEEEALHYGPEDQEEEFSVERNYHALGRSELSDADMTFADDDDSLVQARKREVVGE